MPWVKKSQNLSIRIVCLCKYELATPCLTHFTLFKNLLNSPCSEKKIISQQVFRAAQKAIPLLKGQKMYFPEKNVSLYSNP